VREPNAISGTIWINREKQMVQGFSNRNYWWHPWNFSRLFVFWMFLFSTDTSRTHMF
jgi:hypothetical protein